MKCLNVVALIQVVIGALNWGLWGFFQFDLVAWLFHGNTSGMSRVVYGLVGLAGVWTLGLLKGCCKHVCCCSSSCSDKGGSDKDKKGGGCCR